MKDLPAYVAQKKICLSVKINRCIWYLGDLASTLSVKKKKEAPFSPPSDPCPAQPALQ